MELIYAILIYFGMMTNTGSLTQAQIDAQLAQHQTVFANYQSNYDALLRLTRNVDRRED